jgi:2-oxoglutarate dehydrogenase E2 component (dihydrolipoamide succinyltransferase)
MAIVDLILPKLGESIMEATILKWHKKVGDSIKLDETLLDIATDKVDSEVPSTAEGIITELLFPEQAVVPIGAVIAKIESKGVQTTSIASKPTPTLEKSVVVQQATAPQQPNVQKEEPIPYVPQAKTEPIQIDKANSNRFYSPLVLSIAQSEGISMQELEQLQGTGHDGRVSKKDILTYLEARKTSGNQVLRADIQEPRQNIAPTPSLPQNTLPINSFQVNSTGNKLHQPEDVLISGQTEIIEMDRMRKLIAKHMVDSVQTSPHVTSFVEVDVTNVVTWRDKVKDLFEKREGAKLTYTPIFLECIAQAIEQYPTINASLQGDQILLKKDINLGMATALPSGNLIVPVIKGANQLSIVGMAKAVQGLANAARNNQLRPSDTQGGTFTVTNVGVFGSIMGTPIINQPQVAILALGAIKKRPVVIETPAGDAIVVRQMMYISMSYDHRIVDGALGTQFLAQVTKNIESWDPNRQWFQYV